jgi:shikimate kinase
MAVMQHLDDGRQRPPQERVQPTAGQDIGRKIAAIRSGLAGRSIVLVGMMGAGKTSVGRRLAQALDMPFVDADAEIEAVADMTIAEIFEKHGEPYFRAGETRVLARLLSEGPKVLATGGGAWMNPETRARISEAGVSVWLKAEIDVLLRRVRKRGSRPLLASADPEATLRALVETRYPIYGLADLTVLSRDAPHEQVVSDVIEALSARFGAEPSPERPS